MTAPSRLARRVSILIPHFQTLELTRLCLRLLRRNTDLADCQVVVIDNGSTDGSGTALEQVGWITLVRRDPAPNERPARSHALALNLGVERTHSDLVLIMHTDTMVTRPDWLTFLVDQMDRGGPQCGVVGSWKMEADSPIKRIGKWAEQCFKGMMGRSKQVERYARSHCALYRRDVLVRHPPMFDPSEHASAGQELHQAIERLGHTCRWVSPEVLGHYVQHLNHATMALNAQFGATDPHMPRTRARAIRRIQRFFQEINAERILADHALDA